MSKITSQHKQLYKQFSLLRLFYNILSFTINAFQEEISSVSVDIK